MSTGGGGAPNPNQQTFTDSSSYNNRLYGGDAPLSQEEFDNTAVGFNTLGGQGIPRSYEDYTSGFDQRSQQQGSPAPNMPSQQDRLSAANRAFQSQMPQQSQPQMGGFGGQQGSGGQLGSLGEATGQGQQSPGLSAQSQPQMSGQMGGQMGALNAQRAPTPSLPQMGGFGQQSPFGSQMGGFGGYQPQMGYGGFGQQFGQQQFDGGQQFGQQSPFGGFSRQNMGGFGGYQPQFQQPQMGYGGFGGQQRSYGQQSQQSQQAPMGSYGSVMGGGIGNFLSALQGRGFFR